MDAESTTGETPEQTPEENPRRLAAVKEENGSQSLEDMEGNGDDERELFQNGSLDGDPKMTLGKLIRKNVPVTSTVSIRSAEVPLRGGLLDPDERVRLFVTAELVEVKEVAKRDKEGNITDWTVRQVLRPTYVEAVDAALADPATGLAS